MSDMLLKPVAQTDSVRAIELLVAGFVDEVCFRWCLFADEIGYERRLFRVMTLDHYFNMQYAQVMGAYWQDHLVGVMYLQPLNMADFFVHYPLNIFQEICGSESVVRVMNYFEEIGSVKLANSYYKVAYIAVDPTCRGKGVGTALLEWADEQCQQDNMAQGIQLETSRLENVTLYKRVGYQVMKEIPFAGYTQFLMFKAS